MPGVFPFNVKSPCVPRPDYRTLQLQTLNLQPRNPEDPNPKARVNAEMKALDGLHGGAHKPARALAYESLRSGVEKTSSKSKTYTGFV